MKLVLVCTAVVLLMSAVELARSPRYRKNSTVQRKQFYREANVTPVPEMTLEVDFGGLEVTLGMEITPAEAMDVPSIKFECEPGCYYTVIGLTPDCPKPYDPYLAPFLFVLYANVYCNSDCEVILEDSCALARWRSVSPPPGSGRSRFLLYVYEQKGMIDTTIEAVTRLKFMKFRVQLSYIASTLDLISPPVAGTVWYTQYPLEC